MKSLQDFIEKRPFLYHLTSAANLAHIRSTSTLFSTKFLVDNYAPEHSDILSQKRNEHLVIYLNDGTQVSIRDQQPISMKVLERSLTPGWNSGRFINHLNGRVFFWPTVERLKRHYKRYAEEEPIILRFNTDDIVNLNHNKIEVARLNTGATRCHPTYGGNAPTRGQGTFLEISRINYSLRDIAEFTVIERCQLPQEIKISNGPDGPWKNLD